MSLHHIETDVDKICQWQNGLIQMDHVTPHTSHDVKFWYFRFVFNPLSQSGLTYNFVSMSRNQSGLNQI